MEAEALQAAQDIDFSLTALFLRAHWVVKLVMIILTLASFWSWMIIVDKTLKFRKARKAAVLFEDDFWSGKSLDALYDQVGDNPKNATQQVFASGMREWRRSFDQTGGFIPGARERIDRAMSVAVAREMDKQESNLGFLATVGSTAPFIGLFGTVWGIKNSFEAIAISQNTNLAVVAPGIAEALVATALGLLAAIPAVVAYNKLLADSNRIATRVENFSDEFATILSRQLDRKN